MNGSAYVHGYTHTHWKEIRHNFFSSKKVVVVVVVVEVALVKMECWTL